MSDVQVGDIGFARTRGVMGRLIRLGEWLKLRKSDWNHEFAVWQIVDGVPYIIQATLRGVTDTAKLADVSPGGHYITMRPPLEVDVERMLTFARSQVGIHYGLLTILAVAIDIVTWNWVPSLRGARKPSWICSALVEESLRFGGRLAQWNDIYDITPQESFDSLTSCYPEDGYQGPTRIPRA
jgi:hypothetical protein